MDGDESIITQTDRVAIEHWVKLGPNLEVAQQEVNN